MPYSPAPAGIYPNRKEYSATGMNI
jgi:hypothetical protein